MDDRVRAVLIWLERHGSSKRRDEMQTRYGIVAPRSYGVAMASIQRLARELGRDHALAAALWETGWYEARLLTAYIDDPALVSAAQMDRWAGEFDNWGVVDTLCFVLFDRTPHAWKKAAQWSRRKEEFVKRAGYVMLACLALHDRESGDVLFLKSLALIERGASDGRNFVRKGVSWALRAIGRRSPAVNADAIKLSRRLAESSDPTARTTGKEGLRELASPALQRKLAGRSLKARAVAKRKPAVKRNPKA